MRLEYIGIRVRDLDRSVKFYTELLGLKEVSRGTQYEIGGGIWVLLRDDASNQQLELNWYPPNSPFAVEYSPGEGLDHIGFTVDSVKEKFEELVAKGAVPTEVNPANTGEAVAFLKDPDGNWIEVFERSTATAT